MRVQVNATIDATIDIVEAGRPGGSSNPASRVTEARPGPRTRARGGRDDMGEMIVLTLFPPSETKPGQKPEE